MSALVSRTGLSPRVRGNPYKAYGCTIVPRSIPARAGEPQSMNPAALASAVYPRACGGTPADRRDTRPVEGLSPRVRGNRWAAIRRPDCHGSIPARAGEPRSAGVTRASVAVYPRACGGTHERYTFQSRSRGLSPRVRGNLLALISTSPSTRSIPARAGEPPRWRRKTWTMQVYPRACGGTGDSVPVNVS